MSQGVALERKTATYVDPSERIRPLKDRIFIRPLDWDASQIIIAFRSGNPVRGEVVAVGPGAYRKQYNSDRSKVWDTNVFIPMQVQVGDIVEIGGLNIFDGHGYSFEEITYGHERLLVITEKDVCGIRTNG